MDQLPISNQEETHPLTVSDKSNELTQSESKLPDKTPGFTLLSDDNPVTISYNDTPEDPNSTQSSGCCDKLSQWCMNIRACLILIPCCFLGCVDCLCCCKCCKRSSV